MNWDDVKLFLTVAEQGSFRRAAETLQLGHSTLSRRIEALEKSLDVKLFSRQSTGLTLTQAGEEMLRTAESVSERLEGLSSRLYGQESGVSGHIRLTVPEVIFHYLLAGPIGEFLEEWPDISLEIDCSYELLNLATREADLAIRLTNSPEDSLIGSRLGTFSDAAYATENYLKRFRTCSEPQHAFISPGEGYPLDPLFYLEYATHLPPNIRLTIPSLHGQTLAAEQSLGVAMLPTLIGEAHPKLIRMSEPRPRMDVWLLGHSDTRRNPRLQLFRSFLRTVFDANPLLASGDQLPHSESSSSD